MDRDASSPPASGDADGPIDPSSGVTWRQAAKVWWSLMWRVGLFSALSLWIVYFIVSVAAQYFGFTDAIKSIPPVIVLLLVPIPIEIWAVRTILDMSWSGFHVEVVPSSEGYLQSHLRARRPTSST